MNLTAGLFPGQGEQHPRMLHDLPDGGGAVLDEARSTLGEDPLLLDAAETLHETRSTQLALLIAGVSWFRAAVAHDFRADYLGGHSIGLWAAAVCSDALDFSDALRLVSLRGEAMRDASPPGSGMLVVQGLAEHLVENAAEQVRSEGLLAWSSNVNAASQVAVSGTTPGLDRLAELVRDRGAQRIVRLHVEVPAHSELMAPAAARIHEALTDIDVRRPMVPLIGNVTGQTLFTADALRHELWHGIERPVRWRDGTSILAERGVTRWLQLPPGHSLSRLAAGLPDARAYAVDEIGLDEALARIRR
jgi:malonate decarboxylase epsilon subunit